MESVFFVKGSLTSAELSSFLIDKYVLGDSLASAIAWIFEKDVRNIVSKKLYRCEDSEVSAQG